MASTLGGILSTARTAIAAHQVAVQVASQNVANAETEGYSRQRAIITANAPQLTTYGMMGTGVVTRGVERARDLLLDASWRRQQGTATGAEARQSLLTSVEAAFGEPSSAGFSATLDAFWGSWSDLANDPTSATARGVVQQRATQVARQLNALDAKISGEADDLAARLGDGVDTINRLAKQLAALDTQIVSAQVGGVEAPDLLDQRDRLVDQLAGLGDVKLLERADGTSAVYLGGVTLVDGSESKALEIRTVGGQVKLAVKGAVDAIPVLHGAVGALAGMLNGDLPALRAKLDTLAGGIAQSVNALHAGGWSPGAAATAGNWDPALGATGSGVAIFTGTTARDLAVDPAIAANANLIAAGVTRNGSGDNSLALKLAALRDAPNQVGTQSFKSFYNDTVTSLGLDTRSAADDAATFRVLADSADQRRVSYAGVSSDEELVDLMKHQQAYAAASKVIKTVDEMMQTLLGIKA